MRQTLQLHLIHSSHISCMKKIPAYLLLVGLLAQAVACKPKPDWLREPFLEQQQAIAQTVKAIFDAAKAKDLARLDSFHLYGPKFSKFDDGEIRGKIDAALGQQKEHELFTAIDDFQFNISDMKADVFGQVGIASFIIEYTAKLQGQALSGKVRGTLVFVDDTGKWKITHEHFSPY